MTDFHTLCTALGAKQHGSSSEWQCKCPAHDDNDPSLWLREREGKIVLHCFAGCSQAAIIDKLRSMGLWASGATEASRNTPPGVPYIWPPPAVFKAKGVVPSAENSKLYVKHYTYKNPSTGKPQGLVVRYEGHGKKDTIPFFNRYDNGAWKSGYAVKVGRLLYNADLLSTAKTVYIVEGEKCAANLTAALAESPVDQGAIAITWPGGATVAFKADWTPLIARATEFPALRLILWADNDEPGKKAILKVLSILRTAGVRQAIEIIDLNSFTEEKSVEGYDVADFLLDHHVSKIDSLARLMDFPEPSNNPPASNAPNSNELNQLSTPESSNTSPMLPLSDIGNGERFKNRFEKTARFVPGIGWYICRDGIWTEDPCGVALNCAAEVALSIATEAEGRPEAIARTILKFGTASQSLQKLNNMLEMALSHDVMKAKPEDFDPDPFMLGVNNGCVNMLTGEVITPTQELMISRRLNVNYDPAATCPNWKAFLDDIMFGDAEMITFLKRAVGYTLSGDCSEQKLFLCYGRSGSNGKSVFLETLGALAGGYGTNTPIDLFLLNSRGDQVTGSNMVARLRGVRYVNGSEVPENARLNESRIKEITGQDLITARFLFKEFFTFKPDAKFWIRSNFRPEIRGADGGIWRRIITIPFTREVLDHEKDRYLQEKLSKELPGILNWALEGFRLWKEVGLLVPRQCNTATADYKEDMDPLKDWIDSRCVIEPDAECTVAALYESYREWAKGAGESVISKRQLVMTLKDRGFERKRKFDARYYKGIALLADAHAPMEAKFDDDPIF